MPKIVPTKSIPLPRAKLGNVRVSKIGRRFGRLVVIAEGVPLQAGKLGGTQTSQLRTWLCRCDCGREETIVNNTLYQKRGGKGCSQCPNGHRRAVGEASRTALISNYRCGARVRGHAWSLTNEHAAKLTQMPCHYCGAEPQGVFGAKRLNGYCLYNGIDRVDSTKGYTQENVVACCTTCNRAKSDRDPEEFMSWVLRVAAHQGWRPPA